MFAFGNPSLFAVYVIIYEYLLLYVMFFFYYWPIGFFKTKSDVWCQHEMSSSITRAFWDLSYTVCFIKMLKLSKTSSWSFVSPNQAAFKNIQDWGSYDVFKNTCLVTSLRDMNPIIKCESEWFKTQWNYYRRFCKIVLCFGFLVFSYSFKCML